MARKTTILLVEDDVHDAELLQLAVARAGCSFALMPVTDGADAIQYLAGEGKYADRERYPEPALVLLDLTMPTVSGFDVLRWVKQQPAGTMPPVHVLSYSRLESDQYLARELGAREYLIKPIDLDGSVALIQGLHQMWFGGTQPASDAS